MFLTLTIVTVLMFAGASFFSIVSIYSDNELYERITAYAVFSALVSFILLGSARVIMSALVFSYICRRSASACPSAHFCAASV